MLQDVHVNQAAQPSAPLPRPAPRLTPGPQQVRKNALMVLSHLILNDMMKVWNGV